MSVATCLLTRDAFGELLLMDEGESVHPVTPVRSFPMTAPDEGIALISRDGKELMWLESLKTLPEYSRRLIEEELAAREFMPEIHAIRHVSSHATPSHWQVTTDRGDTTLTLKGEEDIRRLSTGALLITDVHGVQYLIRDVSALSKASRRLLDHFL